MLDCFGLGKKELGYALNFSKLSSLTLRQCSGWEALLHHAKTSRLDELLSLEVTHLLDGSQISYIWALLDYTKSLKDLYISLLGEDCNPSPFAVLSEKKTRLARLIYHTRGPSHRAKVFDDNDSDDSDEVDFDEPDIFLGDCPGLLQTDHPLAGLECLGLSCGLETLV